jgi:hypothetical protein
LPVIRLPRLRRSVRRGLLTIGGRLLAVIRLTLTRLTLTRLTLTRLTLTRLTLTRLTGPVLTLTRLRALTRLAAGVRRSLLSGRLGRLVVRFRLGRRRPRRLRRRVVRRPLLAGVSALIALLGHEKAPHRVVSAGREYHPSPAGLGSRYCETP